MVELTLGRYIRILSLATDGYAKSSPTACWRKLSQNAIRNERSCGHVSLASSGTDAVCCLILPAIPLFGWVSPQFSCRSYDFGNSFAGGRNVTWVFCGLHLTYRGQGAENIDIQERLHGFYQENRANACSPIIDGLLRGTAGSPLFIVHTLRSYSKIAKYYIVLCILSNLTNAFHRLLYCLMWQRSLTPKFTTFTNNF